MNAPMRTQAMAIPALAPEDRACLLLSEEEFCEEESALFEGAALARVDDEDGDEERGDVLGEETLGPVEDVGGGREDGSGVGVEAGGADACTIHCISSHSSPRSLVYLKITEYIPPQCQAQR